MREIRKRPSKKGMRYGMMIRLKGFKTEHRTFSNEAEAIRWGTEREEQLLSIRRGTKLHEVSAYLHVMTGKPRAIRLRPYQAEAVMSAHSSLLSPEKNKPLVCLPTGSGKTIVISALIERILEIEPKAKILVVTHVKELVEQDYQKFLEYSCLPKEAVGIASAGLGRYETNFQITFGTIQTLHSRRFSEFLDYVFIDEAHLLPRDSRTIYRKILGKINLINPKIKIAGFTATPYRLDSGLLTEGEDALFTHISYEAKISDLVRNGYLSNLISVGSLLHVKEENLTISGNEFDEAVSEKEMMGLTPKIQEEILKHGSGRKAWLVFCTSIKHADQVARSLRAANISCEVVSSLQTNKDRKEAIEAFKAGTLRALVNVNVLTTGFDVPQIDMIVSLRPTMSTSLWIQICGRGMRRSDGKSDCLVLDYANNIARHGPIDVIRPNEGLERSEQVWNRKTARICPGCGTPCNSKLFFCPNCQTILSADRSIILAETASLLPLLRMSDPSAEKKRLEDLRDILSWYRIADIKESMREGLLDFQRISEFWRYSGYYWNLLKKYEVEYQEEDDFEFGYSVKDMANELGKKESDLQKEINNGSFPKPRLLIQGSVEGLEEYGYSLLQVSVILSGQPSILLKSDDTFLWYQYLANLLEIDSGGQNLVKTETGQ